jgi:hypothetical protein
MLSGHSRLKGTDLNVSKKAYDVLIALCAEYIPHVSYQQHQWRSLKRPYTTLFRLCNMGHGRISQRII